MNPYLSPLLSLTDDVMAGRPLRSASGTSGTNGHYPGPVHVGVDLGTAYICSLCGIKTPKIS
jgi:hypothetical protein